MGKKVGTEGEKSQKEKYVKRRSTQENDEGDG